jgi:steroid 5-alpha reductase family enzyme
MSSLKTILLTNLALYHLAFFVILKTKKLAFIDTFWSLSFLVAASVSTFYLYPINSRNLVILSLIFLWALRLGVYLTNRNLNLHEDKRYLEIKNNWKKNFTLHLYLKIILLQCFLSFVLFSHFPFVFAPSAFSQIDCVLVTLALGAFFYEAIADYQKAQFKKDSKNSQLICTQGLWKFSKHPNYFGEISFWFCIAMLAYKQTTWGYELLPALLLVVIIEKLSGPKLLEENYKQRDNYKDYQRIKSKYIPQIFF